MKEALRHGNYHLACSLARAVIDNQEQQRVATHVLARALQRLGYYEEAIPFARAEVDHSEPDTLEHAHNWVNLADVYFEAGKLTDGYSALRKGFRILKDRKLTGTPYFIPFWITLSRMHRVKKQWRDALNCIEHALAIVQASKSGGVVDLDRNKHRLLVYYTLLMDKGNCYHNTGKLSEAMGLLWEACQGFLNQLGEEHPTYANVCLMLANVYYSGKNVAAALPLYQEGLVIYERVWGLKNPRTDALAVSIKLCQHHMMALTPRVKNVSWIISHCDTTICEGCGARLATLEGHSCFN